MRISRGSLFHRKKKWERSIIWCMQTTILPNLSSRCMERDWQFGLRTPMRGRNNSTHRFLRGNRVYKGSNRDTEPYQIWNLWILKILNWKVQIKMALTVYWSVHALNNPIHSILGHHQCVMKEDAVHVQALPKWE